jgi:hypothetical protein
MASCGDELASSSDAMSGLEQTARERTHVLWVQKNRPRGGPTNIGNWSSIFERSNRRKSVDSTRGDSQTQSFP